MHSDQIVLHFETAKGRFPDTKMAAQALLDWVALVESVSNAIDPNQSLRIEIIGGAVPGSTRFPQLLRWVDTRVNDIKSAWQDYPHLRSMVIGAAHTLWTASVAAGVSYAITPTEQVVRLSEADRALLEQMSVRVQRAKPVSDASRRFYRTLEQEPAIVGVGIANKWDNKPSLIIPRSQFAERGGLWEPQEDVAPERVIRNEWDVVLVRPVLQGTPHAWRFSRDGLQFSALMHDAQFLAALRDGRVPLNLQEGLIMRVEVERTERLNGQVWESVPRSWKIIRVLSPTPLSRSEDR